MTTPQPTVPLDQPLYGATFGQAVKRFFTKYAVFSGRASRSEYWWVTLFLFVVAMVLYIPAIVVALATATPYTDSQGRISSAPGLASIPFFILLGLFALATLVPGIAVTVRRLHDGNFSGLLYLLVLVPSFGGIIVLVFTVLPSNPAGARFDLGAQPQYPQQYPPVAPPAPPAPPAAS